MVHPGECSSGCLQTKNQTSRSNGTLKGSKRQKPNSYTPFKSWKQTLRFLHKSPSVSLCNVWNTVCPDNCLFIHVENLSEHKFMNILWKYALETVYFLCVIISHVDIECLRVLKCVCICVCVCLYVYVCVGGGGGGEQEGEQPGWWWWWRAGGGAAGVVVVVVHTALLTQQSFCEAAQQRAVLQYSWSFC